MCDKFFESVGVSEEELFSSPLNVTHQVGEKIEGAFVNHFMLTQFFRSYSTESTDKARALIVATHHTKAHWINIATKLGTNLNNLQENGAVTVIDLMKEVYDSLKPKETTDDFLNKENDPLCLKKLYTRCENLVKDFKEKGSKRILIIIEDLSTFLSNSDLSSNQFQASEKDVFEFILKLKTLSILSKEKDLCHISVASLVQSPELPSDSPELFRFAKALSLALPSVMFEVSPLSTGFSAQVSGNLKVHFNTSRDRNPCHTNKKVDSSFIRNYHFKLESNNGVRVIPL